MEIQLTSIISKEGFVINSVAILHRFFSPVKSYEEDLNYKNVSSFHGKTWRGTVKSPIE